MNNFQAFVVVAIVAGLGIKFIPEYTYAIIGFAVLGWVIEQWPRWKKERAKQKQLDADAPKRNEFWAKHEAIRAKYDPNKEWNEITSVPQSYRDEMKALNDEYRAVMDRWHNQ